MKRDAYKRWFDLSVLVLSHLLLLPLWLFLWTVIPLAIWLGDRGPIFYRQKRAGKNGQIFTMLKFRSMTPDAGNNGIFWTTSEDPRVTPVGRFLRRTALDELPELINIWKGEMSLVGPRALDIEEQKWLEKEIPGFDGRLHTLPGLTGLSQVRNQTDDATAKFKYDLLYLNDMSPLLDLKLLVLSVRNTLSGRWDKRSGKPANPNLDLDSKEEATQVTEVPDDAKTS